MTTRIFVSYRREDTASDAGRLFTALRQEFGDEAAFMDNSSMPPGTKWPDTLRSALDSADTIVVLIGPEWLRAGTDEWGRRRIDDENDWVRMEISLALSEEKKIIPTLIRGAKIPPAEVLPSDLSELPHRQSIEIRTDYWDHDIKLLLRQLVESSDSSKEQDDSVGPYAKPPPEGATIEEVKDEKLEKALNGALSEWKKIVTPLPENPAEVRVELFREYKFTTFQEAVNFMQQVAPGCDIALHHPRWENIFKTVRVYLTTWDIRHRISDRDVQLAKYLDRAYRDFPSAIFEKK